MKVDMPLNKEPKTNHPKHHDVDWVFGFYQYKYDSVLKLTPKHFEIFVLSLQVRMQRRSAANF